MVNPPTTVFEHVVNSLNPLYKRPWLYVCYIETIAFDSSVLDELNACWQLMPNYEYIPAFSHACINCYSSAVCYHTFP